MKQLSEMRAMQIQLIVTHNLYTYTYLNARTCYLFYVFTRC